MTCGAEAFTASVVPGSQMVNAVPSPTRLDTAIYPPLCFTTP